ncbi:MAG: nitroreductase family protein [Promethearchaeota archaeon]
MSIIGINQEKCTKCKLCLQECRRPPFYVMENGDIGFNEKMLPCMMCGHCIAICPENAILTKDIDDIEVYPGIDAPETLVEYDKLFQLLRAKRSVRRYKKKKVPKELINKVFEAMRYAPSGANNRMWRYLIISDQEKLSKLSTEILKTTYLYGGFESAEKAIEYYKSIKRDPVFFGAPHLIVLYYETVQKNMTLLTLRANDTGIALTYGMLAAQTLGLGTCWMGGFQGAIPGNKGILDILGIKGHVLGAFIVGYPAVKYLRATPRSPLEIKGLEDL